LRVLPQEGKRKMRALIQIQLGKLFADMLDFCCERARGKQGVGEEEMGNVNKRFLLF